MSARDAAAFVRVMGGAGWAGLGVFVAPRELIIPGCDRLPRLDRVRMHQVDGVERTARLIDRGPRDAPLDWGRVRLSDDGPDAPHHLPIGRARAGEPWECPLIDGAAGRIESVGEQMTLDRTPGSVAQTLPVISAGALVGFLVPASGDQPLEAHDLTTCMAARLVQPALPVRISGAAHPQVPFDLGAIWGLSRAPGLRVFAGQRDVLASVLDASEALIEACRPSGAYAPRVWRAVGPRAPSSWPTPGEAIALRVSTSTLEEDRAMRGLAKSLEGHARTGAVIVEVTGRDAGARAHRIAAELGAPCALQVGLEAPPIDYLRARPDALAVWVRRAAQIHGWRWASQCARWPALEPLGDVVDAANPEDERDASEVAACLTAMPPDAAPALMALLVEALPDRAAPLIRACAERPSLAQVALMTAAVGGDATIDAWIEGRGAAELPPLTTRQRGALARPLSLGFGRADQAAVGLPVPDVIQRIVNGATPAGQAEMRVALRSARPPLPAPLLATASLTTPHLWWPFFAAPPTVAGLIAALGAPRGDVVLGLQNPGGPAISDPTEIELARDCRRGV